MYFISESDNGGQWLVCRMIDDMEYEIIKIYYNKSKAKEHLERMQLQDDKTFDTKCELMEKDDA